MINIVYYNPKLRVHRNGTVEKYILRSKNAEGVKKTIKNWVKMTYKPDENGYLKITVNHKQTYIHRLVGYCFLGLNQNNHDDFIDHIDRNTANNDVDNLRIVSNQQNQWNTEKRKGYYYEKAKRKYHARIRIDNKNMFLGLFSTEEEAHQAYLNAKQKYHII